MVARQSGGERLDGSTRQDVVDVAYDCPAGRSLPEQVPRADEPFVSLGVGERLSGIVKKRRDQQSR